MGQRINTDFDLKYKKSVPCPGMYKLTATEIGRGSYLLSTYKQKLNDKETVHLHVIFLM